MEAIIAAVIGGAVTLLASLIANSRSRAITDTKLEELTREVREHNSFARRMPVVEEQIKGHQSPNRRPGGGTQMLKENWKTWAKAAAVRAIKTVAQTAVATIGTSAVLGDVNWVAVVSASVLAGVLSLLTSVAGLPEVEV